MYGTCSPHPIELKPYKYFLCFIKTDYGTGARKFEKDPYQE